MKNSEYWKKRFEQLENSQNNAAATSYAELERRYRAAQKEIEGKINAWYQRFANNNGISMQEARMMLNGNALKEFQWDVHEYIKYGQENALSGAWMKELENASAKFHVSRLEALKMQTEQSLQVLFAKQQGIVSSTIGGAFQSGYYHTAYELQKGFGIGFDIAGLDQETIEKLIYKPWAADGYNFSERIWTNKEKLISEMHTTLTRNILTGGDPQKAIDEIAKKMNTSKVNAGRLVMTEEAYFSSLAQKKCFNDLDVEQYQIVATLDSHTSDICRGLDGQVFPMKDFEPGVTAPPFHVNCRSTTVPYFDEDFGQIGERAARDEESGQTYYIPDDMKYKDWKETFVKGGDKSGFDVLDDGSALHYRKSGSHETPSSGTINDMEIQDVTKEYLNHAAPGKGTIAYAAGYHMGTHRKEVEIGEWVHSTLGGDIVLLQEANKYKTPTPDYLWNGKFWELKSISSAKAADSALRGAAKQIQENPGGVILELGDGIDMGELEDVLANRFRRIQLDELDILIIVLGVLEKVLRLKD